VEPFGASNSPRGLLADTGGHRLGLSLESWVSMSCGCAVEFPLPVRVPEPAFDAQNMIWDADVFFFLGRLFQCVPYMFVDIVNISFRFLLCLKPDVVNASAVYVVWFARFLVGDLLEGVRVPVFCFDK